MQILKLIKETERKKVTKNLILFVFRVILVMTLFIKGINFVRNDKFLEGLISSTVLFQKLSFLKIVIPYMHILGAFFIIIGVYTRLMIFIQLPIILAAIVILLISGGISYYREIAFALSILILLASYLKFGGGFFPGKT